MNRLLLVFSICCFVLQINCHQVHHFRHRSSWRCRKCVPGWGVVSLCNKSQDTVCKPCGFGYYSNHHSYRQPCSTCSRCGQGLYVAHKCTSTSDTICDSCHTYQGPHNEDFLSKCSNYTFNVAYEDTKDLLLWTFQDEVSSTSRIFAGFQSKTKEDVQEVSAKETTQKFGVALNAVELTAITVGLCGLLLLFAVAIRKINKKNFEDSTFKFENLPQDC